MVAVTEPTGTNWLVTSFNFTDLTAFAGLFLLGNFSAFDSRVSTRLTNAAKRSESIDELGVPASCTETLFQ